MTMQPRLFEPPAKPRLALRDEEAAVKVVNRLIEVAMKHWHFDRNDFGKEDKDDLIEAMMATDSDNWERAFQWIRNNRPFSGWRWEDKAMVLEREFKDACETVLPSHERRGRFA